MFSLYLLDKAQKLIKKAQKHNITISLAESCTGGLLSALLTEIPGSSSVFISSFVTYSNSAKEQIGVAYETINTYGAVSAETAHAMAEATQIQSKSDFTLSITGIAGPEGGIKEKPIGTVYFSFYSQKRTKTILHRLPKKMQRHEIRLKCIEISLDLLFTELETL